MTAATGPLVALFLLLPTATVSPAVSAEDLPDAFEATFTLKAAGTTVARIRWSLSPRAGGGYVSTSRTRPAGVAALFRKETRVERSEWAVVGDRLRPLAYRYERTGSKARSIDIAFDWEKNIAHHDSQGTAWRLPVPAGTLDKFSYLFALMRDLSLGERRVEYTVADGGRHLKHYVLESIGDERIETALGTLVTTVIRRKRTTSKRVTTLWCAEAFGFLPVKIVHVEADGTVLTIRIDSLGGIERSGS